MRLHNPDKTAIIRHNKKRAVIQAVLRILLHSIKTALFYNEKEVISVVELDQFKTTLNAYKHPLQDVRDSLLPR